MCKAQRRGVIPPSFFSHHGSSCEPCLPVERERWKGPQRLSAVALPFSGASWKIHCLPPGSPCWSEVDPEQELRPSSSWSGIFEPMSRMLLFSYSVFNPIIHNSFFLKVDKGKIDLIHFSEESLSWSSLLFGYFG